MNIWKFNLQKKTPETHELKLFLDGGNQHLFNPVKTTPTQPHDIKAIPNIYPLSLLLRGFMTLSSEWLQVLFVLMLLLLEKGKESEKSFFQEHRN